VLPSAPIPPRQLPAAPRGSGFAPWSSGSGCRHAEPPATARATASPEQPRFLPLRLPGREAAAPLPSNAAPASAKRLGVLRGHAGCAAAFWASPEGILRELPQRGGEQGLEGEGGLAPAGQPRAVGLDGESLPRVIFWRSWCVSGELPCLCVLPSWLPPPPWLRKDIFQARNDLVPQPLSASLVTLPLAEAKWGSVLSAFPQWAGHRCKEAKKTFRLQQGFRPASPSCCLSSTPCPGRLRAALASVCSQPGWLHSPPGG